MNLFNPASPVPYTSNAHFSQTDSGAFGSPSLIKPCNPDGSTYISTLTYLKIRDFFLRDQEAEPVTMLGKSLDILLETAPVKALGRKLDQLARYVFDVCAAETPGPIIRKRGGGGGGRAGGGARGGGGGGGALGGGGMARGGAYGTGSQSGSSGRTSSSSGSSTKPNPGYVNNQKVTKISSPNYGDFYFVIFPLSAAHDDERVYVETRQYKDCGVNNLKIYTDENLIMPYDTLRISLHLGKTCPLFEAQRECVENYLGNYFSNENTMIDPTYNVSSYGSESWSYYTESGIDSLPWVINCVGQRNLSEPFLLKLRNEMDNVVACTKHAYVKKRKMTIAAGVTNGVLIILGIGVCVWNKRARVKNDDNDHTDLLPPAPGYPNYGSIKEQKNFQVIG